MGKGKGRRARGIGLERGDASGGRVMSNSSEGRGVSGPCKLNRRNEEQLLPAGLVGEYVNERSLGLCSGGVELDRLVQLVASKAPEEHAGKSNPYVGGRYCLEQTRRLTASLRSREAVHSASAGK